MIRVLAVDRNILLKTVVGFAFSGSPASPPWGCQCQCLHVSVLVADIRTVTVTVTA